MNEKINNKKSILHVVNIFFVLPYFIGDQFLYFHQKDYDVHVICSPSNQIKQFAEDKKFSYHEIPILRSFSILQDIKSIIELCRYIKLNNIEIVSGHTPKGALLSMIAAFIMRVPKRIYFRHGLVFETSGGLKKILLQSIEKLTSKLSTQIICVSHSVYNQSLKYHLNCKKKQKVLASGSCNGIDLNRFSVESIQYEKQMKLKNSLGIPSNAFVVGFTGRLVIDKGIIELVNAFNLLYEKNSNVYLLLVGMLEERDSLPINIIDSIVSHPNIIYTGYVSNAEIEYYYSLMNVFVLPSYREGFPTSVLEASSMQLPVITTKVTGCIDSIIENKTGIFTGHDASDLAKNIEVFKDNDKKAAVFGKNGRNFVDQHFNQNTLWDEIEKLYID